MADKTFLEDSLINGMCELFNLLRDRMRLRIVLALMERSHNVGELCEVLGQKQPTVSHHLSLLRAGHVIVNARQGKEVHYSLNGEFLKRLLDDTLDQWPGAAGKEIKAGPFSLKRAGKSGK